MSRTRYHCPTYTQQNSSADRLLKYKWFYFIIQVLYIIATNVLLLYINGSTKWVQVGFDSMFNQTIVVTTSI